MKTRKLFTLAALASLAFTSMASAVTSTPLAIYVSGAPATRAIWNTAIYNVLGGAGNTSLAKYFTGSSYTTANQIAITGGSISGTPVTIYGSWDGSTGGNQSVAINPPGSNSALEIEFINLTGLPTNGEGSIPTSGASNGLTNLQYPTINLSDTYQATTPFNNTTNVTSPTTSYVALTEATPNSPAVTGFEFVANKGAPADLTNITTNLAQVLFQNGNLPLALFTGQHGDEGTQVYSVGRDISSGARYDLLAETGIGITNSSSLYQYEPVVSSGVITNISNNPSPGGNINLIAFSPGNGGYPSFSAVLTALAASSTPSVGYFITYVTDSDAATATSAANGAKALTWNGVAYSVPAIQEGEYTYWAYLHVYYNSNVVTTNSTPYNFANALSNDLNSDTSTGAILSSSLYVAKQSDGGLVTDNTY